MKTFAPGAALLGLLTLALALQAADSKPDFSGKWEYAHNPGQSGRSNVGNLFLIEQKGDRVTITSGWNEQNIYSVLTCSTDKTPCAIEQLRGKKIEKMECKAYWEGQKLVTDCTWPRLGSGSNTRTGRKFRHSFSTDGSTMTVEYGNMLEYAPSPSQFKKK